MFTRAHTRIIFAKLLLFYETAKLLTQNKAGKSFSSLISCLSKAIRTDSPYPYAP